MKLTAESRKLLFYIAKCMTGGAFIFLLARLFNYSDVTWVLISMVLVLSPDSSEAIPLALLRIKANLAASIASMVCLLFGQPGPLTVCIGFALAILLCSAANVMAASRTALAAVIIIMLHKAGAPLWSTALDRVLSVIAGCLFGLLITFVFHREIEGKPQARGESGE